jgi:hypothetical protein
MVNITDPLLKKLYGRITEYIDDRANVLMRGGALTHGVSGIPDAFSTAMSYKSEVSYIQALQEMLDLIVEIDRDQYGTKQKEEQY